MTVADVLHRLLLRQREAERLKLPAMAQDIQAAIEMIRSLANEIDIYRLATRPMADGRPPMAR